MFCEASVRQVIREGDEAVLNMNSGRAYRGIVRDIGTDLITLSMPIDEGVSCSTFCIEDIEGITKVIPVRIPRPSVKQERPEKKKG